MPYGPGLTRTYYEKQARICPPDAYQAAYYPWIRPISQQFLPMVTAQELWQYSLVALWLPGPPRKPDPIMCEIVSINDAKLTVKLTPRQL